MSKKYGLILIFCDSEWQEGQKKNPRNLTQKNEIVGQRLGRTKVQVCNHTLTHLNQASRFKKQNKKIWSWP